MDALLHCNDLKCRKLLADSAIVTTCSHIFCLPCADRLELSSPPDGQRKCPACGTYLTNLDDAVVAALNPSEDYKTSILSGLNPTVIMECAGRGLSFWTYQMAQEITYQEYLTRSLQAKHQELSRHLESVVREARDEHARLQGKLEAMQVEHSAVLERNRALEGSLQQKQRAFKQQQNLYEKLKRQHMAAGVQLAAEHSVEGFVQRGPSSAGRPPPPQQQINTSRRSGSYGSSHGEERRRMTLRPDVNYSTREHMLQGSRAGLGSSQTAAYALQNTHRQRLPQTTFGNYNSTLSERIGTNVETHARGSSLNGAHYSTRQFQQIPVKAGLGLTANARSSRPQEHLMGSRHGMDVVR